MNPRLNECRRRPPLPGPVRIMALALSAWQLSYAGAGAQQRDSLAGEAAAEALKRSIQDEDYNISAGPVRLKTEAGVGVSYTDNVFYSQNAKYDVMINPQVSLGAMWPITQLNTLHLSLGLAYEWYLVNHVLNTDSPLVNPGSELEANLFVGDFRIRPHERFSYQESLFFNSVFGDEVRFYNFNNVGVFARYENQAGVDVTWDLNKVVLSATYNHENFFSTTSGFEYLDRQSEWFTDSASLAIGDKAHVGVESRESIHRYDEQTILNNNWRLRAGPFVDLSPDRTFSVRAGGGFETAQYDTSSSTNDNVETYYGYVAIRQDTRFFSHSLQGGRELLLGENANNMRSDYIRYSITSPIVAHVELEADGSVNFAEEFGGPFDERFTYYGAGLRASYQFHKYCRADVRYEFRLKDSELPLRDFTRNRVTVALLCTF